MNKPNTTTNKETGNYIEFIIYRFPKKNQESMLQIIKKSLDIFRNEGIRYDYFKLTNTENIPRFTNITKTISANPANEEVWMDLLYYRDRKHRDEFMTKMSNNKECQAWYEEFTELLNPGSEIINGEFSRMS